MIPAPSSTSGRQRVKAERSGVPSGRESASDSSRLDSTSSTDSSKVPLNPPGADRPHIPSGSISITRSCCERPAPTTSKLPHETEENLSKRVTCKHSVYYALLEQLSW